MSNTPISDQDTPDPWIVKHNSTYYLTFTLGNRIEIWSSQILEDFRSARKSVIWQPSPGTPWSADLWAPELHFLRGAWYIYTCGTHPDVGNRGHRTLVLRSRQRQQHHRDDHSSSIDPSSPPSPPLDPEDWEFCGPLRGLPDDQWSIDATVFTLPPLSAGDGRGDADTDNQERLFCCYSGWPLRDHSDTQQDLFLVRLASPVQAIPESLTCISRATLPWERPEGGRRGINEGPTFLSLPPPHSQSRDYHYSAFTGLVFSAHGSWGPEYKLALLALTDATNPCNERSWVKRPQPLLVSDPREGPPFGPGHASFVLEDDDDTRRVYCVYHATENESDGWNNRKARVIRLDPGVFAPDAPPVCCALKHFRHHQSGTGGGGGGGGGGEGSWRGQEKQWEKKLEEMVPAPYRGYLDKVKKRFF